MLVSMTGYGEGRAETDSLIVSAEIRSVNNRYLKVSMRVPDVLSVAEGRIEKLVRRRVHRGTVNLMLRVQRSQDAAQYRLNQEALQAYAQQIQSASNATGLGIPVSVAELLTLPGIVEEDSVTTDASEIWDLVAAAVDDALSKLLEFRRTEGLAMESDLREQSTLIQQQLDNVTARAPEVVVAYRDHLLERVRNMLADANATLEPNDIIREVSVFADRCDINEEITRLRTHLEQFEAFLAGDTSQGRKLDFLGQEIFRETNTIGSKANDVQIAHCVVEMKAAIEKIREIVQNVE